MLNNEVPVENDRVGAEAAPLEPLRLQLKNGGYGSATLATAKLLQNL